MNKKENVYYDHRDEIIKSKQGAFEDWHTLVARWHAANKDMVYKEAGPDANIDAQMRDFIMWANHKTFEEIIKG